MANEIVHGSFSFEKISDGRLIAPPLMLVALAAGALATGAFAGAIAPAPPRGIPKTAAVGVGAFLRTAKREGEATPTSAEAWRGKIKARAEIMERRMVSIVDQRWLATRNSKL